VDENFSVRRLYEDKKLVDVVPGTGVVDFPKVFAELKKQKFDGYIIIERDAQERPDNLNSVIQTIKYYDSQLVNLCATSSGNASQNQLNEKSIPVSAESFS
jgi:L-ribulose-5-phosphate 3-epimerase UlaE